MNLVKVCAIRTKNIALSSISLDNKWGGTMIVIIFSGALRKRSRFHKIQMKQIVSPRQS